MIIHMGVHLDSDNTHPPSVALHADGLFVTIELQNPRRVIVLNMSKFERALNALKDE